MKATNADKIKSDDPRLFQCTERRKHYRALKMTDPEGFRIRVHGMCMYGECGDYMLIDEDNKRHIVAAADFGKRFVLKAQELTPSVLPALLPDNSTVFVSAMYPENNGQGIMNQEPMTVEQLQNDEWPQHIELTRHNADGTVQTVVYDYNFETEAVKPEIETESVAQLIAEGGMQTHDPES